MARTVTNILLAALGATLASAVPAAAYDPVVLSRGWVRVASDSTDECEAEVGSNGKFYIVAVYGLQPGERARFYLTNEEIRPIDRRVTADSGGNWSTYYLPFLWNYTGGTVDIRIDGGACHLSLSFDWERVRGTL